MTPHQPTPNQPGDAARMMQYDAQKKSAVVGYLLWWFLGYFGAHRFDMGRVGSGVGMAITTCVSFALLIIFIGVFGLLAVFVWWIVDAFLLHSWITEHNSRLAASLS